MNQLTSQQMGLIQSLVNLILKNINKNRLTSQRKQQLELLIIQQFLGGVASVEIFLKQTTRDLISKGFTLRESFILLRELNRQITKPTNDEIEKLKFDHQIQQLALYIQPINVIEIKKKSLQYMLFLGPKNRGKTSFLFNLINGIYNINVDSLYRVKKMEQAISGKFLDEYEIEIDNNTSLIFADFKGIGEISSDIIGGDSTNLFIQILEYLQNKNVLAVFFINSASINRLGQDEKYYLQRFFELFHSNFLDKILLILTFCTDNQPILNIYQHPNSPTPQDWKTRMNAFSIFDNASQIDPYKKFWFGINNNYLYQPPIELQEESKKLLENFHNYDQPDSVQNFESISEGQDLSQNIETQTLINEQGQDIELTQRQVLQFYYEIMKKQIDEIILRIKKFQREIQPLDKQWEYWKSLLQLEKELFSLTKRQQIEYKIFQQKFNPIFKAVYIDFLTKQGDPILINASLNKKILFCSDCQALCHQDCELISKEELAKNQKLCSKLQIRLSYLNQMTNPTRVVEEQYLDKLYYCKVCSQRENIRKEQDNLEACSISNHLFLNEIKVDQKCDIYYLKPDSDYSKFSEDYQQYKFQKQLLRMQQQQQYKCVRDEFQKVKEVKEKIKRINSQNIGIVPINCQIRQQQLNDTLKAGAASDNSIQSSLDLYNKMFPQKIEKQYSKAKAQIIKIQQNDGDIQ